jgi:hypothetical protein
MRCVLPTSTNPTSTKLFRIPTLALVVSIVFVFSASSVYAEAGMAEDMEVATQAGTSLTPVTTEAIMEIMSATNLVGLQRAQSDSVTLRIRIFVSLQIKFGRIASSLAKRVAVDASREGSEQV